MLRQSIEAMMCAWHDQITVDASTHLQLMRGFACIMLYGHAIRVMWSRLHVVAEPVDVHFFNPEGITPRALPLGQLVFGRPKSALRHVAFLSVTPQYVLAHSMHKQASMLCTLYVYDQGCLCCLVECTHYLSSLTHSSKTPHAPRVSLWHPHGAPFTS